MAKVNETKIIMFRNDLKRRCQSHFIKEINNNKNKNKTKKENKIVRLYVNM